MAAFDRRLTPARRDLAAVHLQGQVTADRFVDGAAASIAAPVADLLPRPEDDASPDTQLLLGETVTVFERRDGWAWVQASADGYVGYQAEAALGPAMQPTHRIATLGSNLYRAPSLKTRTCGHIPFAARVAVQQVQDGYAHIGDDLWLPEPHLVPVDHRAEDWVATAEMFLGVPYLWGGRSSYGLDCSALIQLARLASGFECLRDSDMQFASEGHTLPEDAALQRGDLLFWRGHVGVMTDPETLLHANGHHMAVVREPVQAAIARILAAEDSPVTRRARLTKA